MVCRNILAVNPANPYTFPGKKSTGGKYFMPSTFRVLNVTPGDKGVK
jgi:hypothetical protein